MSGGGLNYLHNQDLNQIASGSDLDDVISYLRKSQFGNKAANYSQRLRSILNDAISIANDLKPVWEAIDRYLSHDWGDEDVDKALVQFNKSKIPSTLLQAVLANAGNNISVFKPEPDRILFNLINQNTKAIAQIQQQLNLALTVHENGVLNGESISSMALYSDEIQKLSQALASLSDSQSKLVAIAQSQEPDVKRIFDYTEHLANDKKSTL